MRNKKVANSTKSSKNLSEKLFYGMNPDADIVLFKPSDNDLIQYSKIAKEHADTNYSINHFLQEKYGKESIILFADLSNMEISNSEQEEPLDLKHTNFRGAYFSKTRFVNCDLSNSIFADTKLYDVAFKFCNIDHADFRGCNLESCQFGREYRDEPYCHNKGIKISVSPSELRIFSDIKNEISRKNEQQRILDNKRIELRDMSLKIDSWTKFCYRIGLKTPSDPLKKILREVREMENGIFHKEYIIHKSIINVFVNDSFSYYPIYEKYLKDIRDVKHKKYIKLTRKDIEEFVANVNNPLISLNEFAKKKYIESHGSTAEISEETFIVADLSSKVNQFGNNEWNRTNLVGISFVGRDISYVNFAGTDLSRCNFSNSCLRGANLDCSKISDSVFRDCDLSDASLISVQMDNTIFEQINALRVNMSWSHGRNVRIINSDFSYVNTLKSDWFKASIESTKFCGTIFENTKINRAKISNTIFDSCVLNKASLIESNYTDVIMNNCLINNASLRNSLLHNVKITENEGIGSDYTGIKFSKGSDFSNNNMSNSIFDGMKATLCKINNCIFDKSKMAYAKFSSANLLSSSFKFAELNNCVFVDCIANNTDYTCTRIFNVQMMNSIFKDSIFCGAIIEESNLVNSNFENSNWTSLRIIESDLTDLNNHRVKINDCTEIINSVAKRINGQFYRYDEDNFMEIMFFEHQQSHQYKIKSILKFNNYGAFSIILKIFSKHYRLPQSVRNGILKSRKRNRLDLRNHILQIQENNFPLINEIKFRIKNLIKAHNL